LEKHNLSPHPVTLRRIRVTLSSLHLLDFKGTLDSPDLLNGHDPTAKDNTSSGKVANSITVATRGIVTEIVGLGGKDKVGLDVVDITVHVGAHPLERVCGGGIVSMAMPIEDSSSVQYRQSWSRSSGFWTETAF